MAKKQRNGSKARIKTDSIMPPSSKKKARPRFARLSPQARAALDRTKAFIAQRDAFIASVKDD